MSRGELLRLCGDSYCISGRINLGLYDGASTVLIDSGFDSSYGKMVKSILDARELKLDFIANSHAHADHIGGNRYLKERTSAMVVIPELEKPFAENTLWEPAFLWGASPFSTLQNKLLMAPPCEVDMALPMSGFWEETDLEIVCLSGHSVGMVGYKTPDNVFYLADSVFSQDMISRHGMLFLVDLADWLVTLDRLETVEADYFVPAHSEPVRDIAPLLISTRRHLMDISDRVWTLCSEPKTRDDLLAGLMMWLGKTVDPVRYVLNMGALSAHITYLVDKGELETIAEAGRLYWRQKK